MLLLNANAKTKTVIKLSSNCKSKKGIKLIKLASKRKTKLKKN